MLHNQLNKRLTMFEIQNIAQQVETEKNNRQKEVLFKLLMDDNKRVSDNAAWILTHCDITQTPWFKSKQEPLINEALITNSITKRRLILTLLCKTKFDKKEIRTDFLDFCIQKITDIQETPGTKSLCMKLAFLQCQHYAELQEELRSILNLIDASQLPPSERTTRRKILQEIESMQTSATPTKKTLKNRL